MNLTSLRPQSKAQMLIFPSTVPEAMNSPELPLETMATQGDGTAQAVAFVTWETSYDTIMLYYISFKS